MWYASEEPNGEQGKEQRPEEDVRVAVGNPEVQENSEGGDAVKTLRAKVEELEQEVARLESSVHEEQMMRIRDQATLQRDKNSFEARTKSALFLDLLSVVDSFEQLVRHGEEAPGSDGGSLLAGAKAVLAQLNQFLTRNGIHRIEGLEGAPYDSGTCEIAHVVTDSDLPPNTVVHVLREGYRLGDMLLRPAVVDVVASAPRSAASDTADAQE
jgi:molecular chaperone GrpE